MDESMSMESMDSFPGGSKSQKTGKLYTCVYCSYSADKKVSLNRHMRMHSGLSISANQMPNTKEDVAQVLSGVALASSSSRPVTPGKSPSSSVTPNSSTSKNIQDGVSALERYCQDCDIQFSSIKTFRVHKQYYCSTRHVLKAQQTAVAAAVAAAAAACAAGGGNPSAALGKAPLELGPGVTVTPVGKSSASVGSACSPIPGEGSPVSTPGPMASQPFVVLPTNPVIVVPYCFIQGASFLPGNVLPSQNAIVVLPNGTVQSLPGTGGAGAGGIPIPVPSPSPQSMILGSHLMMHSPYPTGTTPGPSSIMSPNNLSFPDPKEMMKLMASNGKESRDDHGAEMMLSPNKLPKPSSRNSGRSSRSSEDEHHHKGNNVNSTNDTCDDGSMPAIDLTFRGIQPKKENHSGTSTAGDDEKENREEICGSRNNRQVSRDSMHGALEEQQHSRSRSVTPAAASGHATSSTSTAHEAINSTNNQHHRDRESPLEKMSMGSGSGGKRTPRPSSASVSSSCSTPPTLCEPKINGIMSQMISPGGVGGKDSSHDPQALNNKMVMMMLNAGAAAAAAAAALEGGNGTNSQTTTNPTSSTKGKRGSMDYSSMTMTRSRGSSSTSSTGVNGGKISPISTQLPGGAILTSATSNQSLAELLMTNPPELNESLAKLNPQLLMNAHRAAAAVGTSSPVGFNFNINPAFMQALSPEIAMRLLDPAYLSTLQQSIQQQQQQQTSSATHNQQQSTSTTPSQGPVKRGVSKCVECDIVFYKTENYLVHKEYYCAARGNNTSSSSNIYPPQAKTPTASSSKSAKGARDNGTRGGGKDMSRMSSCSSPSKSEVDDEDCISPPPPMHRKISTGSLRKSPDSINMSKPKSKSPPNAISNSPQSVSPVPSPKSFGVGVITANNNKSSSEGKGGNQFSCSECGVKFSSIDNLQTHQAFYCNKSRKAGGMSINFGENPGGDQDGKNGEQFMMELLASSAAAAAAAASGQNSQLQEKEMLAAAQAISLRNKSPGPGGRNGFLRCGKCKLSIPEEQMGAHIRVCLGSVNSSFGNGRGNNGGDMVGWKCPCCDFYSPTVSQAQKHLETHTGIRAFKCLLCGYRGNTLRGMRTHIRTHFDKRVFDLLEGDYMTCITANDVDVPSTSSSTGNNNNNNNSINNSSALSSLPPEIQRALALQSPNNNAVNSGTSTSTPKNNGKGGSRYSPETCKNVNQPKSGEDLHLSSPSPSVYEEGSADIKVFQSPSEMMMMTMMTENDSNTSSSENNNQLHYCNLCNYTSPFKANILKHMKLVHKVQIPIEMGETEAMLMLHNTLSDRDHDHHASVGENTDPLMHDVSMSMNGESTSRNSTPKPLDFQTFPGVKSQSQSPTSTSTSVQESTTPRTRSRGNGSSSVSASLPNGTSGIALDIKEESLPIPDGGVKRKCSSHSSAEDNTKENYMTGNSGSNYCKSCDISFQYVSSFNAHKKFYCSSVLASSDTEAPERAETPVQ